MSSRETITRCEVFEEDGRIISRQIVDTVLADEQDIDRMIEELDRQIALFENALIDVQKTIFQLQEPRRALIAFKNEQEQTNMDPTE